MGTTEGIRGEALTEGLTDAQREAVLRTEGPLLVLAAAGSGKTRVITRRIAHLIDQGVPAWSVLALTFTNKAAGEMRERVLALLGEDPRRTRGLTVTTFHALCARLLRRFAPVAGLPGIDANFTIYDSPDQAALVKRVLGEMDMSSSNWPPRSVLAAISSAKNELLDAAGFEARAGDFYSRNVAKVYHGYERALRAAGAVDFDDLLLLTARMLRESGEIREQCQERWQYLLIDEYQDTNHAQFMIASLLAGEAGKMSTPPEAGKMPAPPNICVVGDPDQSIYGWRGANIANILEFEEHYPDAAVIALGENFRSTAPILAVADGLIRHNRRRKHKDLYTRRVGGEPVRVVLCQNERHEAELVTDEFRRLKDEDGLAWRDMAVFYRTNALSRVMEDSLRTNGIPYVIARGTAFYQREEIKNALAYLRLVANQADDISLERIVNTPTRGIGKTSLAKIQMFASGQSVSMFEAMRRVGQVEGLSARAAGAVGSFVEMVDAWTMNGTFMGVERTPAEGELAELVERVVRESGLEESYKKQAAASKLETDAERVENLGELVSSARQFEEEFDVAGDPAFSEMPGRESEQSAGETSTPLEMTDQSDEPPPEAGKMPAPSTPPLLAMLRAYLESVTLVADADAVDPAQGAVTLMTLHAAKGLEFETVAMIGLEEGLLPHGRANESEADLEEERRLCFVGITRAMRRLMITSAKYRTHRGMSERTIPSRFLEELGREHVTLSDQAGLDDQWEPSVVTPRRAGGRRSNGIQEGSVVMHPRFGVGTVVMTDGGRVRVKFREVGTKTLVLEFARLEVVG
jgi:DNA helicase-2/ATP-dependent DNA helicase PcrA